MKVCIFGAGAIGGHLASVLARGGAEVSAVARGVQLAAIREHGITVEEAGGTFHARIGCSDDPAAFGPQDAVIVAVKSPALPSVAARIGPLLGPDTPVVFAMNGIPWWYFDFTKGPHAGVRLPRLDPGGAMRASVGPDRAIGGVVYAACTVVAPGIIRVASRNNQLILGEPGGAMTPRLAAIAGALRVGGLPIETTPRIRDAIWTKLVLNLCTGPFCVLTQGSQQDALSDPAVLAAARAVLAEARAVAHALGCPIEIDADRTLRQASRLTHKPSILQDLELGRPMEVESLLVAPAEMARMAGVSTPVIDLLVGLVRVRAAQAGLYSAATP